MAETQDPFFEHARARHFLDAALTEYDKSGDAYIPQGQIDRFAQQFCMARSEAAAMAFLARNRVREAYADINGADLSLDIELYLLTNEREG